MLRAMRRIAGLTPQPSPQNADCSYTSPTVQGLLKTTWRKSCHCGWSEIIARSSWLEVGPHEKYVSSSRRTRGLIDTSQGSDVGGGDVDGLAVKVGVRVAGVGGEGASVSV